MKLFSMIKLKILLLTYMICGVVTYSHATRVIDNFNGPCDVPIVCADRPNTNLNPGENYFIRPNYGLGGQEEFYFFADTNNSPGSFGFQTFIHFIGINQLILLGRTEIQNAGHDGLSDGGYVNILYDGKQVPTDTTNNFGLNNIDLTELNNSNVFSFDILSSTAANTLDLYIYSDADNFSQVVELPIPFSDNLYQRMDVLFSELIPGGVIGGADFTNVTAIELRLNHNRTDAGIVFSIPLVASGYALALEHFSTRAQLNAELEASLENDINGDGDFDSAALPTEGDTILYTVTLTNTEDLRALEATGVTYAADFSPLNASFIPGSVSTTQGSIVTGNGGLDSEVLVNIGTIADDETVTITYQVKIDSDLQGIPDIEYLHSGAVSANEWGEYELVAETIETNKFDIQADMSVAALDDADLDGFSGPEEQVRFTVSLANVGVNTSDSVIFDFNEIPNASLVTGSVTTNRGSVTRGNGGSDTNLRVSINNFVSGDVATISFDFLIDESFSFHEYSSIGGQALVTNSGEFYFGLSDDPEVVGTQNPTFILVDAFPDRLEAYLDGDGDGLPECDPDCVDEDPFPNDTDNDGTINDEDDDDDNDGVDDGADAFPFHCEASTDSDGDGKPDQFIFALGCSIQSAEASKLIEDLDDDNDETLDVDDDFPTNRAADTDTDNDGQPNNWLESCDGLCRHDSGLILDPDDDNDGINDVYDAFPLNVAASLDADGDGFPDSWNVGCNASCQSNSDLTLDPSLNDTDNDGVKNPYDAFNNDCSASVDTDGDGKPNQFHDPLPAGCVLGGLVVDDDDDEDGVLDVDDAFPLNPHASSDADKDGRPEAWTVNLPVWIDADGTCSPLETPPFSGGNVDDSGVSECESSSGLTFDHFPNDTDNNGTPNIDPEDPDYGTGDDDGDGILNEFDEEPLRDNNPPIVIPPVNRVVTASAVKTTVLLGIATATDIVQGVAVNLSQSNIHVSDAGPFKVGVHTITWSAEDAAGNIGTATQIVTVKENPDLEKDDDDSGGGGGGSFGLLSLFALMVLTVRRRR